MILVRYIIREHFFPFVAAFGVITFLFAINQVLDLLDQVLSKGLPIEVLAEILMLSLAWMLALSIPMSVLVASLLAFGRLSADHEITAIKAAGISPLFMIRPMLILASLVTVVLVIFNNWVLPEANYRAGGLLSSISRKKPTALLEEGRLINDFPGVQLWISEIDRRTGTLYGVRIYETPSNSPLRLTFADTAQIEYADRGATILLHLRHGSTQYQDSKNQDKLLQIQFARQTLAVENVDDRFDRRERGYRGDREMDVDTMWTIIQAADHKADSLARPWKLSQDSVLKFWHKDSAQSKTRPMNHSDSLLSFERARSAIEQRKNQINQLYDEWKIAKEESAQYSVEVHKKFSIPFAALAFVLVGAPLGIMARRGGLGIGVILSLVFFVAFWALLMSGERLGDQRIIPAWLAMWSPHLLIVPIGIYLCYKMLRDRYSGNSWWRRLFYKWRHRKKAQQ